MVKERYRIHTLHSQGPPLQIILKFILKTVYLYVFQRILLLFGIIWRGFLNPTLSHLCWGSLNFRSLGVISSRPGGYGSPPARVGSSCRKFRCKIMHFKGLVKNFCFIYRRSIWLGSQLIFMFWSSKFKGFFCTLKLIVIRNSAANT